MSSTRNRRLLPTFLSRIIPVALTPCPTDLQNNVDLLEQLHLRHLQPLPITHQQQNDGSSPSPPTQRVTSIASLQQLFDNPVLFYDHTLLSITEFFLLHSHLEDAILNSRSHIKSSSSHQHIMPTKLNTVEQLMLWIFHISDDRTKTLSLMFKHIDATTVLRYVDHITWCINTELDDVVAWPSAEQRRALYGWFSICDTAIAVLDGTHCPIQRPVDNEINYYSGYKHRHTQNYLVCVDAVGVVIYMEGPFNGHDNDRTVFKQSDLYNHPERYLEEGEKILADGGFVGGGSLLVPIHGAVIERRDDENERQLMKEINDEFTGNRLIVEDVFGWIKARAHVLDVVYGRQKERQGEVFKAACRLHNFVRIHRIDYALSRK